LAQEKYPTPLCDRDQSIIFRNIEGRTSFFQARCHHRGVFQPFPESNPQPLRYFACGEIMPSPHTMNDTLDRSIAGKRGENKPVLFLPYALSAPRSASFQSAIRNQKCFFCLRRGTFMRPFGRDERPQTIDHVRLSSAVYGQNIVRRPSSMV